MTAPVRTLAVSCPDWPLTAMGVPCSDPAVVLSGGRIVAASTAAREAGVVEGQRRREATFRCPGAAVLERDEEREARRFEAVVVALGEVTPWVEAQVPGACSFGVRGPVRLFGGEEALVRRTAEVVDGALDGVLGPGTHPGCRIGVADGPFAAGLAARGGVLVPAGGTREFLSPLPVGVLGAPGLSDVLVRLGLATLGSFAGLSAADVAGRFGAAGLAAHRLASGLDDRPPARQVPPPDLAVEVGFDPPVDRVDRVAFAARSLAESLHAGLAGRGLSCTRVLVEAETCHGEHLARRWRDEGTMGAVDLADRVRWQLEGWLNGPPAVRPTSGLVRLGLTPDGVVAATGHQAGFWGGASAADERAARALARLDGLLGSGSVRVPEWRGGRGPAEQLVLVPFATRAGSPPTRDGTPWPGALPPPAPAAVHSDPAPVELLDPGGRPVGVDARGALSAAPSRIRRDGLPEAEVAAWSGPWPVDERWWDPQRHRRLARLQVVDDAGTASLLVLESGRWLVAATYD